MNTQNFCENIVVRPSALDGALVVSTNATEVGAYVDLSDTVGDICAIVTHAALVAAKELTVQIYCADNSTGTDAVKISEAVYTEPSTGTPKAGVIKVKALRNPDKKYYNVKITTDTTTAIAVTGSLAGFGRYSD
jgi:hypothetical protein